jgi:hypothetical protein
MPDSKKGSDTKRKQSDSSFVTDAREAANQAECRFQEAERVKAEIDGLEAATAKDWIVASRAIADLAEAAGEYARKASAAASIAREKADGPNRAKVRREASAAEETARTAAKKAEDLKKIAGNESDAAIAAELKLNVEEFFTDHKGQIYKRLEECDEIARKAASKRELMFIAEGLPIVNSFIHVGSSRADLNASIEWVTKFWGIEADPFVVLSALVFIWIANKGVREFGDDPDEAKRATWNRIRERVERLI